MMLATRILSVLETVKWNMPWISLTPGRNAKVQIVGLHSMLTLPSKIALIFLIPRMSQQLRGVHIQHGNFRFRVRHWIMPGWIWSHKWEEMWRWVKFFTHLALCSFEGINFFTFLCQNVQRTASGAPTTTRNVMNVPSNMCMLTTSVQVSYSWSQQLIYSSLHLRSCKWVNCNLMDSLCSQLLEVQLCWCWKVRQWAVRSRIRCWPGGKMSKWVFYRVWSQLWINQDMALNLCILQDVLITATSVRQRRLESATLVSARLATPAMMTSCVSVSASSSWGSLIGYIHCHRSVHSSAECPDHCSSCEWSSDQSAVLCLTGSCYTGYGLTANRMECKGALTVALYLREINHN